MSLCFTQFMVTFVQELRKYGCRVLVYLYDLLISPSSYGTVVSKEDCVDTRKRIYLLMESLGLQRHQQKGEWE